jgi:hypothetical protein
MAGYIELTMGIRNMAKNSRTREQPLDFRKEEVGRIMERWRASESCSLIGVGSVGKSNLLQHLADPRVQNHYMEIAEAEKKIKAIIIDPTLLGAMPDSTADAEQFRAWAGYELLMHRLYLAFFPLTSVLHPDDAIAFEELLDEFRDGHNPLYKYMGLRYLELGLEFFMRAGIQIVFMFDEFDEMLRQLPVKFFQALRGIRDINKKQLSFLTFTRVPMLDAASAAGMDLLDIEPFAELFTDSVVYVGPYNEVDTKRMLSDLERRNNRTYGNHIHHFLTWSTGGYAGLLRASFRAMETFHNLNPDTVMRSNDRLLEELASRRAVREECRTIWTSLSELERIALRELTLPTSDRNSNFRITAPDIREALILLRYKNLLEFELNQIHEGTRITIKPPVLFKFIQTGPEIDYE